MSRRRKEKSEKKKEDGEKNQSVFITHLLKRAPILKRLEPKDQKRPLSTKGLKPQSKPYKGVGSPFS